MSAPMRWKDESSPADPELRELLKHAAQRGPNEAQLAAMSARVKAELAPRAIDPVSPQGVARGGQLVSVARFASWTALSMLAGVGGFSLWMQGARPEPPSSVRVEREEPPIQARDEARESEPAKGDILQPVSLEHASDAPARAPVPRPTLREAKPREPTRSLKPEASPEVPSEAAELTLLRQARLGQRENPSGALSLLRQHEREHPEGMFREEREALMIELLTRTGERQRARARARAFFSRYPASAYQARLAEWLEDVPPPVE